MFIAHAGLPSDLRQERNNICAPDGDCLNYVIRTAINIRLLTESDPKTFSVNTNLHTCYQEGTKTNENLCKTNSLLFGHGVSVRRLRERT